MKKILAYIMLLATLMACRDKSSGTSYADSTNNHYSDSQIISDTASFKSPSKEEIKDWQNMCPILNGKSSNREKNKINYKEALDEIDSFNNIRPEEKSARGLVNLKIEDFIGKSVPFTGNVIGNIAAIYVDNKKINFIADQDLFFRLDINVHLGYNRIPVKIINKADKVFTSYLEFNYPL